MQGEIARRAELLRSLEDSQESLQPSRPPTFSQVPFDNGPPLSPRQIAQDDSRRPSLANINSIRPNAFRPPMAPHLGASPRRFGSIGGGGGGGGSPSSARPPTHLAVPPPPPPPPPTNLHLSAAHPSTNLPRRHTSADIRLHGWQGAPQPAAAPPPPPPPTHSPYASGQNSSQWPSSPHRTPLADQQLRDALARYELPRAARAAAGSRQPSPPAHPGDPASAAAAAANLDPDAGWRLPGSRFPFRGIDTPGPPTRRSSMASNVHSLLNPAETAEREGEEEPEERKRRRVG